MNWTQILDQLETGELRAAKKINGQWVPQIEVKQAILEAFKNGELKEMGQYGFHGFVDKHTIPPRQFTPSQKIRLVPGGSSVRRGSYLATGVIIMPPAYVNIGAFV